MSIIFGFLNKNYYSEINDRHLENVINDLTLNGKRHLKKVKYNNIIFCHAQLLGEREERIVENEDNSLLLIMGGEIFDYRHKLKDLERRGHEFKYSNNPAEFILHSFEEFGADVFKNLNGNFAIAVWDRTNNLLVIANDTFGFHPLFIYDSKEAFIFCSEYQPLLKYSNFRSDLNYDAIAEYFIMGFTLNDKTFFKHIESLAPATVLESKANKLTSYKYDTLDIEIQRGKPITFFAERIEKAFKAAVNIRKEEINTCTLSGGLDTRFILACLSSEDRKRKQFITYQSPHFKEDEDKDVICAKILAEKFKLKHNIVKRQDEVDFSEKFFDDMRYTAMQYSLKGIFGGELLGGDYLKLFPRVNYTYKRLDYINKLLARYFTKSFIKKIDGLTDLCFYRQLNKDKAMFKNKRLLFSIDVLSRSFFTSVYKGAFSGWLCPYSFFLNYYRYPFIDKEFLKILLSVPPEYLQNYTLYIELMKIYHHDLMSFPCSSGALHDSRIKNFKKGKYHWKSTRHNYNKYLQLCLREPTAWGRNNYNIYLQNKVKIKGWFLRCLSPDSINDILIIKFLNFEAWLRKYYLHEQ